MDRSALAILLLVIAALPGCTDNRPLSDAPTPDPWDNYLWSLVSLNGEAVTSSPSTSVFATRSGSVVWFEAGCGFSVSVADSAPVVRDPHRDSRPCAEIDLRKLATIEAMVRGGGTIAIDEEQLVITNGEGRSAVFQAQEVWGGE